MINTAVDPAIKATSILITNTSGLNQLTLVKDALEIICYNLTPLNLIAI